MLSKFLEHRFADPRSATGNKVRIVYCRLFLFIDSFKDLVENLVGSGARQVVTFCEYRATLDYLERVKDRKEGFPVGTQVALVEQIPEEYGLLLNPESDDCFVLEPALVQQLELQWQSGAE